MASKHLTLTLLKHVYPETKLLKFYKEQLDVGYTEKRLKIRDGNQVLCR